MNRKVLIASQVAQDIEILQKALIEEGLKVSISRSSEECLRVVPKLNPHVVLIDDTSPALDGYETCRRIKAEPGNEMIFVVLLLKEGATTEERIRGHEVGALGCMERPVSNEELIAKLRVYFRLEGVLKAFGEAHTAIQKHSNKMEKLVRQRTAEIVATRDVTVFSLAKLAESRDPETGEHLERIQRYTKILAAELAKVGPYRDQIDEGFLDDLYRSSPLHDIGKVGIPDVVLLKPGPLSAEEFEVMKQHTLIGAEALETGMEQSGSAGGFLRMAVEIARSHHERVDGSGYPIGMSGQDIPLSARIVSVADVFDALTSTRVYKDAYHPELAREMIVEDSGKHFDPPIVDAFRSTFLEFVAVYERYNEGTGLTGFFEDSPVIKEVPAE